MDTLKFDLFRMAVSHEYACMKDDRPKCIPFQLVLTAVHILEDLAYIDMVTGTQDLNS